ncbi:hypothetical protein SCP_0202230 [Sparassis crispa]|uniref:Uncharacterized protein n=1 Tax=Sparassis crispa TaxID=139825 RepID=A0A401GA13_9APHY|nr:hypothetical protein SCP_0202230 [Sparassis crispa]GBE79026.1 hypothetical protein SCP_0202230 [Sparassis crispa]
MLVDDAWTDFQSKKKKGRALYTLLQKLKQSRDHAEFLQDELAMADVETRLSELEQILSEAGKALRSGAEPKSRRTGRSRCPVINLVTLEELEAVYREYVEAFIDGPMRVEMDISAGTEIDTFQEDLSGEISNDLSVMMELGMSCEELMNQMGLKGEVLPFMYKVKNKLPYLIWTVGKSPHDVHAKLHDMGELRRQLSGSSEWEDLTL